MVSNVSTIPCNKRTLAGSALRPILKYALQNFHPKLSSTPFPKDFSRTVGRGTYNLKMFKAVHFSALTSSINLTQYQAHASQARVIR